MTQEQIQNFANENDLDVRPIQDYHYRLMNSVGKYILDVYFKRNKNGVIVKNSVLNWRNNRWSVAHNLEDLNKLIHG